MTLPPVIREIHVPAPPEQAFAVFTDQIGTWWPIGGFSVHGDGATVAFVEGVILESAPGLEDAEWGRVLRWEPPRELAFTWYPGAGPERASQVTVTFGADGADGAGTLVRLVHTGWEVFAERALTARTRYEQGWPRVLGPYEQAFAAR